MLHIAKAQGGIRIPANKTARKRGIERFPAPSLIYLPVCQHRGSHALPNVKAGERVLRGQKVADSGQGLSCPVHSPVSGAVVGIEAGTTASGERCEFIIIENDGKDTAAKGIKPFNRRISDTSFDEIAGVIREAGIAGMGGGVFPTYAKLFAAKDKARALIINCAECEPYGTADYRLLLERPEQIINGMKILLMALGLREGIIAVGGDKPEAFDKAEEARAGSKLIKVKLLKGGFPSGEERGLIYEVTGKRMPDDIPPPEAGYVVINTATCAAVCNAFVTGMPLVERVVTVAGERVAEPKNLLVPLGTPMGALLEHCGLRAGAVKIVAGGPMMGEAVTDMDTPITKGISCLLALDGGASPKAQTACLRCGKCADACPRGLLPNYIAAYRLRGDDDKCAEYGAKNCVACGCCSYVCPAGIEVARLVWEARARF